MHDLIEALTRAEKGLEKGDLGPQGLEQACSDARELYERLIVLRHKAREQLVGRGQPQEEQEPGEEEQGQKKDRKGQPFNSAQEKVEPFAPQHSGVSQNEGKEGGEEQRGIRLDTRPPEVPRQVSLIEAIEQEEKPAPKTPELKAGKPRPPEKEKAAPKDDAAPKEDVKRSEKPATLAEKLEKARIASLGKSISLSHKFWFVSELYNGDRIFYEKSIELIDNMNDLEEARTFVQKEVIAKLKKTADAEAINTFMDLIERRFQ